MRTDLMLGVLEVGGVILIALVLLSLRDRWARPLGRSKVLKPASTESETTVNGFPWWTIPVLLLSPLQSMLRGLDHGPPAWMDIAIAVEILALVAFLIHAFSVARRRLTPEYRITRRAAGGDVDGAIGEMLELIESSGATGPRSNGLGLLYLERGMYGKALKMFAEAEKLLPSPICRLNQAVALRRLGRFDEAEAILRRLCEHHPRDSHYRVCLAAALIERGRLAEARDELLAAESLLHLVFSLSMRTKCRGSIAENWAILLKKGFARESPGGGGWTREDVGA